VPIRGSLDALPRPSADRGRRHRQARHHQAARRHHPDHLQRAPAVHLRRRHRPRPGVRQQPQPQRRAMARDDRFRLSRRRILRRWCDHGGTPGLSRVR
jgi:hypothetical protein